MRPGPSTSGPNSRIVREHSAAASPGRVVPTSQPASPQPHHTLAKSKTVKDWSPRDDGIIEITLPNSAGLSREEVDSHIFGIFYDRYTKRRLPVFASICEGQ